MLPLQFQHSDAYSTRIEENLGQKTFEKPKIHLPDPVSPNGLLFYDLGHIMTFGPKSHLSIAYWPESCIFVSINIMMVQCTYLREGFKKKK